VKCSTRSLGIRQREQVTVLGDSVAEQSGDRCWLQVGGGEVRAAYVASVAAGQPLSQRAMAERFGLSRRKVSQLTGSLTAESNGHLVAGTGAGA